MGKSSKWKLFRSRLRGRGARAPCAPLLFSSQPMRSELSFSHMSHSTKTKHFKALSCDPYDAKWSKRNAVMWIRPQSKLEKVSQVRNRLSWSDSEKNKQRHVGMSSSFVIRIQVWAALSVLAPLLQSCQLPFLQHLQLPPPYFSFYSHLLVQDRTTSLRHFRHQYQFQFQFQFQFFGLDNSTRTYSSG